MEALTLATVMLLDDEPEEAAKISSCFSAGARLVSLVRSIVGGMTGAS